MATRKTFIDEENNEITPYLVSGNLFLKIKFAESTDIDRSIVLSGEDAKEFIMELYRIKKKIN
jgi:hypothetical protein